MKLEDIKRICEAATSGSWKFGSRDKPYRYRCVANTEHFHNGEREIVSAVYIDDHNNPTDLEVSQENITFITTFNPERVKKLIAVAEAAQLIEGHAEECPISAPGGRELPHGSFCDCGREKLGDALAALESDD